MHRTLQLPYELQSRIISSLTVADLASVRLTSKQVNEMATPCLFANVTLEPHIDSYHRILMIAATPHLRRYVRRFTYDTAWLHYLQAKVLTYEGGHYLDYPTALWWAVTTTSPTGNFGSGDLTEATELTQILQDFPHLKSVGMPDRIVGRHQGSIRKDHPPQIYKTWMKDFYTAFDLDNDTEWWRGADEVFRRTSNMHALLRAFMDCDATIDTLDILMDFCYPLFDETDLAQKSKLESALSHLKALTVHHASDRTSWRSSGCTMSQIYFFLRSATNLEFLSLEITHEFLRYPDGDGLVWDSEDMYDRTSLYDHDYRGVGPLWSSKIRELRLNGLRCSTLQLQDALSHCAATLRFLQLENLTLIPEQHAGPRSCFVKLFKWIQSNLTLSRVSLQECFNNFGFQRWKLRSPTDSAAQLKTKLEDFVVSGGRCPIEFLEIEPGFHDFKCPQKPSLPSDYKIPEELEMNKESYEGDPSFEIIFIDPHDPDIVYGSGGEDVLNINYDYNSDGNSI